VQPWTSQWWVAALLHHLLAVLGGLGVRRERPLHDLAHDRDR
jgi:hypothetical protein